MICWMRAAVAPAAVRNASFALRASSSSLAHPSDKNLTPTTISFVRLARGSIGARPPILCRRSALGGEERRFGEMTDVGEEPHTPLVAVDDHRIHRCVLREEETVAVVQA